MIRIAGVEKPVALVKSRFMKLNYSHIEYVLFCLNRNTTKVGNIKAYLLTALYNAPATINLSLIHISLLKRDLLITAALLHDVGKTKELSSFPLNDYTDEGQLLGHIIIGAQMIHDLAKEIPDFPETLENQLVHCILAHHGELEYGSPKKPALAEAVALNLADNTDARMETLTEIFAADKGKKEWLGYNRLFESNLRRTGDV